MSMDNQTTTFVCLVGAVACFTLCGQERMNDKLRTIAAVAGLAFAVGFVVSAFHYIDTL